MLAEFKKTKDRQLRPTLIGAMSSFRERDAIDASMNALLSSDVPFLEGAGLLFSEQRKTATRKVATRKVPFEFLKAHWDQVVRRCRRAEGHKVPGPGLLESV
jgi:hypothetical protein